MGAELKKDLEEVTEGCFQTCQFHCHTAHLAIAGPGN